MEGESKTTTFSSAIKPSFEAPGKNSEPSNLVGKIIEKGFSATLSERKVGLTPPPRASVLPFPVARHRSHGPHWPPLSSKVDDEDDNEDKFETNFVDQAHFSQPIPRKKKKGLDFSRWRELVSSDCVLPTQEKKASNRVCAVSHEGRRDNEPTKNGGNRNEYEPAEHSYATRQENVIESHPDTNMLLTTSGGIMTSDMGIGTSSLVVSEEQDQLELLLGQGSRRTVQYKPYATWFNKFEEGQGNLSPLSDIDAENRALLQKMSPVEVAESRAEIMEKFQPGIIEMLKKRGQDKVAKPKDINLDAGTMKPPGSTKGENHTHEDSNRGSSPLDAATSNVTEIRQKRNQTEVADDDGRQVSSGANESLWKPWINRVEKARTLRFSLDASPMENYAQVSFIGNTSENATERDFLRTEGDPGGAGYTVKEAVSLIRSKVPGQRSLALQLLVSVLDKALCNLQENYLGCKIENANLTDKPVDWQAVWAFALGPEPQLVLALRMALDSNHISVIVVCIKVLQCILSCNTNENFFSISEKLTIYSEGIYTAPVFRSRPKIDHGFLNGGFWKYNTKSSKILPFSDENMTDEKDEENKGERTVGDDIVVAEQDVVAGLVRMVLLPRIHCLLEMENIAYSEESLISVLIGVARHSPSCSDAIIKCPRLVQTVVSRFAKKDTMEIYPSMIKSVTLVKVLAQSDKKNCGYFVKNRMFNNIMWHLYKYAFSLDHWTTVGKEQYKLTSALMIEQLSFWKVCIQYGYCISYFSDFFPAICFWLNPPTLEKLNGDNDTFDDYTSVAREAFLTLDALARRLPYLHSEEQLKINSVKISDDNVEHWSWSHALPMVEFAMKWLSLKSNSCLSLMFNQRNGPTGFQNSSLSCLLWVISAVMHMLSSICERITPNLHESGTTCVPWLPEFIPRIGLEIAKNGFLNVQDSCYEEHEVFPTGSTSLVESLCQLRHHKDFETSLSSVCCLHELVRLINSLDKSIQVARNEKGVMPQQECSYSRENKIVEDGIAMSSRDELTSVLIMFMTLVCSEWQDVQSIEMFGRGGPAPGIGVGWGASGGGFWSGKILLAEMDARLVIDLFKVFPVTLETEGLLSIEDMRFTLQLVNSALAACLIAGPRDKAIVERSLDFLLGPPVLKCLDFCIHHFLCLKGMKLFKWDQREEDYLIMSVILSSHFRARWLSVKRKASDRRNSKEIDSKSNPGGKKSKRVDALSTIHEEMESSETIDDDPSYTSLMIEWAYQRLPLPVHWFLSPISSVPIPGVGDYEAVHSFLNTSKVQMSSIPDVLATAKAGLFLLLGFEALSSLLNSDFSCLPVRSVPLVWKLHALSMVLLVKQEVLEDERSRNMYESLQELYGQSLDQLRTVSKNIELYPENGPKQCIEFLKFKTNVHESYPVFLEVLIEQFSAASYGDLLYGRQVALYLHRSVEAPVRLAAWNALSNSHVLDILPSLEECFGDAQGYLQPVEDNDHILEAYVKSWISGALDKAVARGSISFTVVLHHLTDFIFHVADDDKLSLRKKLAKSLLRDYSRKQRHEGMMLKLIEEHKPGMSQDPKEIDEGSSLPVSEIERRFNFLSEACEGNNSMLAEIEKLKSNVR